ncbi:MAG: DUF4440 domain-containing protein [Pyrinomonadaceae bacterium]|nr:DUF4440 domain-containing protein [Pyrinomonadaceae bacterium]
MRKTTYIFICCLVLSGNAFSQKAQEIIKQERFFYDSLKAKKMDVLPTLFHKDFHGVNGGGYIDRKTEIEGFSYAVLQEYEFSNILVKFPSNNVGTIIYKAYIKGSYKGKDVTGNSYHTSTWVKKGNKWKMIMHMEVPVSETLEQTANGFRGLATLAYKVSDIEKAAVWYSKAFGKEPYFKESFYVGFDIGGYELGLQPEEGKKSIKGNGSTTYWAVEDIEAMYKRFIDAGATEHEKPENVGGDIKAASVKDPWGNIIGLIYNPAFKN